MRDGRDSHYARPGLGAAILAGLRAAGKDPEAPTLDDLAPVDQFHTGGKRATLELARLAGLAAGMEVLDVGGGLGGPARTLAHALGCRVTVLDLTEEYCRVGEELTRRTGLSAAVSFHHGDALALPFPAARFDAVWSQHSSMNVDAKERLYAGIRRVLRPGGRLALHEVMAGEAGPPHFPVPWAREPSWSFLAPPEAVRALLRDLGFREVTWQDETAAAVEWFRRRVPATEPPGPPPPLGLHLLLGADAGPMFRNLLRNLAEGRIVVIAAVLARG